jgi:hypothetical protein
MAGHHLPIAVIGAGFIGTITALIAQERQRFPSYGGRSPHAEAPSESSPVCGACPQHAPSWPHQMGDDMRPRGTFRAGTPALERAPALCHPETV